MWSPVVQPGALGLLILIATPVARVATLYVLITLVVLVLLLYSMAFSTS